MSADGEKEKGVELLAGYKQFSGGERDFTKVEDEGEEGGIECLGHTDRALAVMERPHHSSSLSCHALLPSLQGLPSGAEQGCVGERWLLCHSSPPLVL